MKFVEYAYLVFIISQIVLVVGVVRKAMKIHRQKKLNDEK
jgi:hypothetical protein